MTVEFRQKLLNWLTSAVICLGYFSLANLVEFYVNSENVFRLSDPQGQYRIETATLALGNTISLFVMIAVPAFIWHASDFLQKSRPKRPVLRASTGYRCILAITIITVCGAIIVHSGVLASLHCTASNPEKNVFVFCTPNPSRGILPLVFLPWCMLALLCVAKALTAAYSWISQ